MAIRHGSQQGTSTPSTGVERKVRGVLTEQEKRERAQARKRLVWWILGALGAMAALAIVVMLVVLLTRQSALERDLGLNQPPPPRPISAAEARFTPGTYKVANPKATDGAEVVASFYIFAAKGDVQKAMALADHPDDKLLLLHAESVATDRSTREMILDGVTIEKQPEGNLFDPAKDRYVPTNTRIVPGKVYQVFGLSMSNYTGVFPCIAQKGGRWLMTSCPEWER